MPEQTENTTDIEVPNFAPRLYGITVVVGVIMLLGIFLVSRFSALDLARDMRLWQDKLNLIADSRTADVSRWTTDHFKELSATADNPSLQLYLMELQSPKVAPAKASQGEEPAQKAYLRNLLTFTGERMHFVSAGSQASRIPANVPQDASGGLAVMDNDGHIVVSTSSMPAMDDHLTEALKSTPAGEQKLIDIYKNNDGVLEIGFIVPIFSIQGDHDASAQIGRLLGIKPVDEALFGLLKHPGVTEQTMEVLLVRQDKDNIQYISPLKDGTAPLGRMLKDEQSLQEAAFAVHSPGSFSERQDYRSTTVFVTGRAVPGTPWTLVVKIDKQEAMAESEARRTAMAVFLLLLVAFVSVTVIAVWRTAVSRRSMEVSRHFRILAARAMAQEQLLRLVADNQHNAIYILDHQQVYRFANRKEEETLDVSPGSLIGKKLPDVLGPARALPITDATRQALAEGKTVVTARREPNDIGNDTVLRIEHIPLTHIPVQSLPPDTPGVLVSEYDVSDVVHEREHRLRGQKQLIETLIRLVDKRDPYAANHSMLVAQVAEEIATAMELDSLTIETTRIAGSLMNIGKIVIPSLLLTKTDALKDEEKKSIRESIFASADLLKGISFDGPVVETLRQSQEHWDGTGPQGLKGEGILISARIIAVANAFVGMASPRSYRKALSIDDTVGALLEKAITQFDRRVVVSLVNYVENKGGRATLEQMLKSLRHVA